MNRHVAFSLILILMMAFGAVGLAGATQGGPPAAAPDAVDALWRPLPGAVYLSTAAAGTVGGVAFAPADIIRYDPAGGAWSMVFDASDVGVTKNVVAFEMLDDNRLWLSFAANQPIPGVGVFTPQDIAVFTPTALGPNTAGTFAWLFDGSAHSLTTTAEKIDGLARWSDGSIILSTTGTADVVRPNGTHLKVQDEDAVAYDLNGDWYIVLDGTGVAGLKGEDVNGLWVDPGPRDVYVNTIDAFNLGGVRGDGKDIVRLRWQVGVARPSVLFDGSAYALPARIDAIDLAAGVPRGFAWPIGCVPGQTCSGAIGYPDVDNDGKAFNCGAPGYRGHGGTDIGITWTQMDAGMPVYAAADGWVQWAFDGKYDRCPSDDPECRQPGWEVCSDVGNYCWGGGCCCLWCFAGNVVVIRHSGMPGVFGTVYGHLREGSILVQPGQYVSWGQKIAEAASSGASSGPHLHFELWGTDYYKQADPWAGPCGPNTGPSLWAFNPPWTASPALLSDLAAPVYGAGDVTRYEPPLPASLGKQCGTPLGWMGR